MSKFWKGLLIIGLVLLTASGAYTARRIYTPSLTVTRVASHLIPQTDNIYDVGIATREWRNMWVDGTANIDIANVGDLNVYGVFTSDGGTADGPIIPAIDDTYDLGTAAAQWRDIYINGTAEIDDANTGTISADTVDSNLEPAVDDTYNLGSAVLEWQYLWIDGIAYIDTFGEQIIPAADDAYDIGAVTDEWRNLYIDGIAYIDLLMPDAVGVNLLPNVDNTYSLGGAGIEWQDLHIDNIAYIDTLEVQVVGNFYADIDMIANGNRIDFDTDNDTSLRATADDELDVETGGADRYRFDDAAFGPLQDDAYDIGEAGNQWQDLYVDGVGYIDQVDTDDIQLRGNETGLAGAGEHEWFNIGAAHVAYLRPLAHDNGDTSTAAAGVDALTVYNIPANVMHGDGGITIRAAGTKTGANDTKQIWLNFGAFAVSIHGAANTQDDWRMEAQIVNTATNAQRISWVCWDGAVVEQGYETTAQDTTGVVAVYLTAECVNAGDTVTQTMWYVELF